LEQAMRRLARADFEVLLGGVMEIKGARVLAAQVDGGDPDRLREMADWFRDRVKSGVAVLGTVKDGKPLIVAAVTEDLIGRGLKAGDIVREVAKVVGGGGGGRADMAQAGGRNPEKLAEALDTVRGLVEATLKELG
jgi:alanyl-tRNA synthetase